MRDRLVAAFLLVGAILPSAGCDRIVKARFHVTSTTGEVLGDALIRREEAREMDLASYTDADGCAEIEGFGPVWTAVRFEITKEGYRAARAKEPPEKKPCVLVTLAPEGDSSGSTAVSVPLGSCPCAAETGYRPRMKARFRVQSSDLDPVAQAELRRADRPRNPWAHVTDADGCLGVSWIVAAYPRFLPLSLEKTGFWPAYVEVPILGDLCYEVTLSRIDEDSESVAVPISRDACACEMFSGRTVLRDR